MHAVEDGLGAVGVGGQLVHVQDARRGRAQEQQRLAFEAPSGHGAKVRALYQRKDVVLYVSRQGLHLGGEGKRRGGEKEGETDGER